MPELLNPYIAGAPVTEASMFFGRQDVFDWIEHSLAGKYVDHILVIHGQRRVGKTSVLKQIPHHLPNRYIQVYLDLQGRAMSSLDRFLWWMSREILRTLRISLGITIAQPEQSAFALDPEYFHIQFLPALRPHLQERNLLLTFDEFDILSQPETMQSLGPPLTEYLSHLFELQKLNFVFSIGSSGRKLENMQAAYTEFFKAALYKKISFLEQAECYQLITRPVMGTLTFDPGAVEHIYQVTSGHPYYTQLTCHELFSACQKHATQRVRSQDVEAILPEVVERGTVNLKFVWDEASDLEKWALACLAQVDGIARIETLATELESHHVRFSEPDLNSALLHLQEKDVLRPDLSFVVHLLRLWLQTNRPLGRVREELVEINPIANRFIEIGDEYRDRREQQEALRNYQQALVVDPSNLKAQLSIASVHLAAQDWGQAAGACERALELDPDDVHARAGFCQAHLALSESALERDDVSTAIEHLRSIVAVNPDHVEVRQRLADILCHQAEDLLARGENESALKAFLAAQAYVPEDENLHQRYIQVCGQFKGQVLADLLEKARRAWQRQNWGEAIASLEDYLQFEPDSGEVRTRLEDLRHQQRQHQLEFLKTQAQELENTERWDEAILAWQDYIALEPEDRPQAETALQAAGRFRSLAETYAQAQNALRQKEFSRAIPLLQGIIAQEPSYKDTARLLAEAIVKERARRPVWKQRWVWAALVFVILAALTGMFGRGAMNYLSSLSAMTGAFQLAALPQVTTPAPSQASSIGLIQSTTTTQPTEPGSTATVTATMPVTTTVAPAWVESFVQPLMDEIAGKSPDFQDDFSEDKDWTNTYGFPTEKTGTVQNGNLRLTASSGETSQSLPRLATDYILEVDFQPDDLESKNAVFALNLRGAEGKGHYRFEIDPDASTYRLEKAMLSSDNTLAEGSLPASRQGSSAILKAFVSGSRLAFLWDDTPLVSVSDNMYRGADNQITLSAPSGSAAVDIDAVRLWDLNPIELPVWVQTIAKPLLISIRDRPPDFEDDFSQANPAWMLQRDIERGEFISIEKFVKDGVFRFDNSQEQDYQKLYSTRIQARDFIMQFDLTVEKSSPGQRFYFDKKNVFSFYIDPSRNECELGKWESSYFFEKKPCTSIPWNEPHQITFISSGDRFGVYMYEEPWGYVTGVPDTGLNNRFWLGGYKETAIYVLDNFKFWNLDSQ